MTFKELHERPFLPIATERLLLRPIAKKNAEAIALLLNNYNVNKTLARVPFPYSLSDAHEFIKRKMDEMSQGKDCIVLGIRNHLSNEFLGLISYEFGTIGYW